MYIKKIKIITEKSCLNTNCNKKFTIIGKNKRKLNRKYCSIFCSKQQNGRNNKNKKRTKSFKKYLSIIMKGKNNPFYGKHHSKKTKELISKANKGKRLREQHPNWKDGRTVRKNGYISINIDNGIRVYEHRLIMEKYLGRKLAKDEIVHHKNENKQDNRLENLELTTQEMHSRNHALKRLSGILK